MEAEKRLDEAIRIESARFNRLKSQGTAAKQLGINNVALSAAKLIYLQSIREASKQNGYQNPDRIIASVSDPVKVMAAARPLMQQKGFSEMAQRSRPQNLRENFDNLGKKPGRAMVH